MTNDKIPSPPPESSYEPVYMTEGVGGGVAFVIIPVFIIALIILLSTRRS